MSAVAIRSKNVGMASFRMSRRVGCRCGSCTGTLCNHVKESHRHASAGLNKSNSAGWAPSAAPVQARRSVDVIFSCVGHAGSQLSSATVLENVAQGLLLLMRFLCRW